MEKKVPSENAEPNLVVGFVRGNDLESISGNYIPLIVLDAWEHAYVRDFGVMGRKQALITYLKYLDWGVVEDRFHNGLKQIEQATQ